MNGNIHSEHAISVMLKESLLNAGIPECAILQERIVSDKGGNLIHPDIVVADIRTGQPIAIFEIKAKAQSEQSAFIDARRAMAHFIDRCPCYVVTAINGGGFAVASVFSKDTAFPIWIPLSEMEQFKAMFGNYRDATAYAEKMAASQANAIKENVAKTGRMVFLVLTIVVILIFGTAECYGVVFSAGLYTLTALLIACTAGAFGLAVHLKVGDNDLSVAPANGATD